MDGLFMKTRDKIIISLIFGFIAMSLCSFPMWWGVLFSPIAQQLTGAPLTADIAGGVRWELDGIVLRFRTLDLLLTWLRSF